jgi:hypothetical protein
MAFAVKLGLLRAEQQAALALALAALEAGSRGLPEAIRDDVLKVLLGLYPIVTLQYSSTTLYQVSYHIQYLFFESDNQILP